MKTKPKHRFYLECMDCGEWVDTSYEKVKNAFYEAHVQDRCHVLAYHLRKTEKELKNVVLGNSDTDRGRPA